MDQRVVSGSFVIPAEVWASMTDALDPARIVDHPSRCTAWFCAPELAGKGAQRIGGEKREDCQHEPLILLLVVDPDCRAWTPPPRRRRGPREKPSSARVDMLAIGAHALGEGR